MAMANAWTENGPISLPSHRLVYGAGLAVVVFAVLGLGMGFEAALRKASTPELGGAAGQGAGKDDALEAKPIVDLAPPTAAPKTDKANSDDAEDAKADALAAQTAAAQAIQAKPSKTGGDIDDVLASPTERPPSPTKSAPEEAPPGTPVKSDVPF
jgi:hypothetical protein